MDDDIDTELLTREDRLEDFARRQTTALESLRNIAWGWSLLAVIALLLEAVHLFGH